MIEIPRNLTANRWKLGVGVVLILIGIGSATDPRNLNWVRSVIVGAISIVPGILFVVSNLRMLIVRPPQLRATDEGVAFAGGAVIPWHEIKGIYEAGTPIQRYGYSVKTRAIAFAFHRWSTLFRVPSTLWLSTMILGDVKISTYAAADPPSVLVPKLDSMRERASELATAASAR